MKKLLGIVLGCVLSLMANGVFAQEHGGKTVVPDAAPAVEAVAPVDIATPPAAPAAEDIRKVISDYVAAKAGEAATFTIDDPDTKVTRQLTFDKVHERVGKTGDNYYSCADFTDKVSGEKLDLDFDVASVDGKLNVVDTRIHKVNDVARYTYDENDNRIPVAAPAEGMAAPAEGMAAPAAEDAAAPAEAAQEHAGHEHGGTGM